MMTNVNLWKYLAKFFLEWDMFRTNIAEKNHNKYFTFHNFPLPPEIMLFVR
jgi:hypothetical protein